MADTTEQEGGSAHPRPPEAPEHHPRTRIPLGQMIGVPFIMLLPVLAIAGVFDDRRAVVTDASESLSVRVEYPARTRHRVVNAISAWVMNHSASTMDTVFLSLDATYVEHFTDLVFTPDVSRAYRIELTDVAPGETRLVQVELRAHSYGNPSTEVSVVHGRDTVGVRIGTTILP